MSAAEEKQLQEYIKKGATKKMSKFVYNTWYKCFEKDHIFANGSTILSYAVRVARITTIRFILEHDHDRNQREDGGATPLLLAIQRNDFEIVELLVRKGANVNLGDSHNTPLTLALRQKNVEIIKCLINYGASLTQDIFDVHPFLLALDLHFEAEIIRFLLEYKEKYLVTVDTLNHAIRHGNLEAVKLLLEYGLDINEKGKNGDIPLMVAVKCGRMEIVEFLLQNGADLFYKNSQYDGNGRTVLEYAILQGNIELIDYLLNNGAVLMISSEIEAIAKTNHVECLKLLIEKAGLNVEEPVIKGVFQKAFANENITILNYLSDDGVKLTDVFEQAYLSGQFQQFLNNNNLKMLEFILQNGVDINSNFSDGSTALITQINVKNVKMVKFLLEHGADVNKLDTSENSPIAIAYQKQYFQIFQVLVESGAILNEKDQGNKELAKWHKLITKGMEKTHSGLLSNQDAA